MFERELKSIYKSLISIFFFLRSFLTITVAYI
jgi:hypothetical protein